MPDDNALQGTEVDSGERGGIVPLGQTPIQPLPPLETVDVAALDALPPSLKRELEEAWGACCCECLLQSIFAHHFINRPKRSEQLLYIIGGLALGFPVNHCLS